MANSNNDKLDKDDKGAAADNSSSSSAKPGKPPASSESASSFKSSKSSKSSKASRPGASGARRRYRWPFVLLLVLLAGGAYVMWPTLEGNLPPGIAALFSPPDRSSAKQMAALEREIEALKKGMLTQLSERLAKLEADQGALDRAAARYRVANDKRQVEIRSRLDSLESGARASAVTDRLRKLEGTAARSAKDAPTVTATDQNLQRQLVKLTARMADLEGQAQAATRRGADPVRAQALGQLRAAVAAARPFAAELQALKKVVGDDTAYAPFIDVLAPYSAKGTLGQATLSVRFADAARKIACAPLSTSGAGWWRQTLAQLSTLISWRRTGENVAGTGTEARLARAEAHIAAGRLTDAVDEIAALSGPAAAAAATWLQDAEARLKVDRAVAGLDALFLAGPSIAASPSPVSAGPGGR